MYIQFVLSDGLMGCCGLSMGCLLQACMLKDWSLAGFQRASVDAVDVVDAVSPESGSANSILFLIPSSFSLLPGHEEMNGFALLYSIVMVDFTAAQTQKSQPTVDGNLCLYELKHISPH